jgi:hypothetical protein
MEPIRVPKPPSQAFRKNRRVSDLIRAQTNHLKHVEEKLPPSLRQQIPQHAIVTEADAASYIGAMTRLFHTLGDASVTPAPQQPPSSQPIPIRPAKTLQLAAAAEPAAGKAPGEAGKACAKAKKSGSPGKGRKP